MNKNKFIAAINRKFKSFIIVHNALLLLAFNSLRQVPLIVVPLTRLLALFPLVRVVSAIIAIYGWRTLPKIFCNDNMGPALEESYRRLGETYKPNRTLYDIKKDDPVYSEEEEAALEESERRAMEVIRTVEEACNDLLRYEERLHNFWAHPTSDWPMLLKALPPLGHAFLSFFFAWWVFRHTRIGQRIASYDSTNTLRFLFGFFIFLTTAAIRNWFKVYAIINL